MNPLTRLAVNSIVYICSFSMCYFTLNNLLLPVMIGKVLNTYFPMHLFNKTAFIYSLITSYTELRSQGCNVALCILRGCSLFPQVCNICAIHTIYFLYNRYPIGLCQQALKILGEQEMSFLYVQTRILNVKLKKHTRGSMV